jgi:hypothetical protein
MKNVMEGGLKGQIQNNKNGDRKKMQDSETAAKI